MNLRLCSYDIGRKVWCALHGWGRIVQIPDPLGKGRILVRFEDGRTREYLPSGKLNENVNKTLHFNILPLSKPKTCWIRETAWINIYQGKDNTYINSVEQYRTHEEATSLSKEGCVATTKVTFDVEIPNVEHKDASDYYGRKIL